MKALFIKSSILLLMLSVVTPSKAQTNGNFDSSASTPPRGQSNVPGYGAQYNDLSGWQAVDRYQGSGASSSPMPTCYTADYLATNATNPIVNPQGSPYYGPFTPHSGNGCVAITREPGSYINDQFISQQVSLTPNHSYQATFWVLRRPGYTGAEKIALTVHNAKPAYAFYNQSQNRLELTPAPFASIVSAGISDYQNWTKVTGTFVVPAGSTSTYIVLGYDRSQATYDPSIYTATPDGSGGDYYAIDDVSLTDMGCVTPPTPKLVQTDFDPCTRFATYSIANYDANNTYTISLSQSLVLNSGTPINNVFQVKGKSRTTGGTFVLTATNSCGGYSQAGDALDFTTCAYGNATTNTVTPAYPNPASDIVNIAPGLEDAVLLDNVGRVVQRAEAGKLRVDNLSEGIYFLRTKQGDKLLVQPIQVKH